MTRDPFALAVDLLADACVDPDGSAQRLDQTFPCPADCAAAIEAHLLLLGALHSALLLATKALEDRPSPLSWVDQVRRVCCPGHDVG